VGLEIKKIAQDENILLAEPAWIDLMKTLPTLSAAPVKE